MNDILYKLNANQTDWKIIMSSGKRKYMVRRHNILIPNPVPYTQWCYSDLLGFETLPGDSVFNCQNHRVRSKICLLPVSGWNLVILLVKYSLYFILTVRTNKENTKTSVFTVETSFLTSGIFTKFLRVPLYIVYTLLPRNVRWKHFTSCKYGIT